MKFLSTRCNCAAVTSRCLPRSAHFHLGNAQVVTHTHRNEQRHGFSHVTTNECLAISLLFFSYFHSALFIIGRFVLLANIYYAHPSVFRPKWWLIGRAVALVVSSVHCELFSLSSVFTLIIQK